MAESVVSRRKAMLCAGFVVLSVLYNLAANTYLIRHLPDDAPNGGPDEPMHISVATYIASHLSWPPWNAAELERYTNGSSYATSSSVGYWLEGLLQRLFGVSRLSAFALFAGYLALVLYFLRKSRLAGLLALAAITPQFLFVFSYVNSDAWTAMVSLALGLAVSRFRREPGRTGNIVFLFAAAGACVTCRFHVWPIGFVAFMYALVPQTAFLLRERRRQLCIGLATAIAIASWWPLTSYFANDGDIVGFTAQRRAVRMFGNPNAPPLARPLRDIDLTEYSVLAAKSFYGVWGWGNFLVGWGYYLVAALLGVPLLLYFWSRRPKLAPLHVSLLMLNFALMLVYSTQYDYQWQGRYLYPWFFISMGLVLDDLCSRTNATKGPDLRWTVLLALIAFSALNGVVEVRLWQRIERAEKVDLVEQGYFMLDAGQLDIAANKFKRAIARNAVDPPALNGLAIVMSEMGETGQAEDLFRKAVEIAPKDPISKTNLAALLMRKNLFAEAVRQYEDAERLEPRSAFIQAQLVNANKRLGNLEAAWKHCQKALEIAPNDLKLRRECNALEAALLRKKGDRP